MKKYFDTVINRAGGSALEGVQVLVLREDGSAATLYSDDNGTPLANPVVTDINGLFSFYVADGAYTLEYRYDGELAKRITDVEIYDKGGPDGPPGPKGEDASDIGLFTAASQLVIRAGINAVTTIGFLLAGVGGATYIADPTVTAAYAAAHPRLTIRSANERGFRLVAETLTPEQFGALGDGVTDDTDAFTALSARLQELGGGVVKLRPGAVYIVGKQRLTGASALNQLWSYAPQPIIQLFDGTKPFILDGNGAEIKCANGLRYGAFNGTTGEKLATGPGFFGSNGERATPYEGMLHLRNHSGLIAVRDVRFNGNSANLIIGGEYGDTGRQIPACGMLWENCSGAFMVENVDSDEHAWDGWLLNQRATATSASNGSVANGYRGRYNARQSLSLTGGRNIAFNGCVFNLTGRRFNADLGGGLVSSPAAGIDIEAEGTGIVVRDITFTRCEIYGNAFSGINHTVNDGADVTFNDTKFIASDGGFAMFGSRPGFRFNGCTFVGEVTGGFVDTTGRRAMRFRDCLFTGDPIHSPNGQVSQAGAGAPLVTNPGAGATFIRCHFDAVNGFRLPAAAEGNWHGCTFYSTSEITHYTRGNFYLRNVVDVPAGSWAGLYDDAGKGGIRAGGKLIVNGVDQAQGTFTIAAGRPADASLGAFGTTIAVPAARMPDPAVGRGPQTVNVRSATDVFPFISQALVSADGVVTLRGINVSPAAASHPAATYIVEVSGS